MKKIIEIFKNDLKNLTKSKMAIMIIIGIIIIPGIYAWLNIDSNWGPYDNTGNLPLAIVNKDEGVSILGQEVNVGDKIEDSLKENKAMKWIFTNEKNAKKNTKEGKYYGAIIIPKNFSKNITTIMEDGKVIKPKFDFYVNNKKNAIAPIIVNKAVGTIQTSVNQAFVNEIIYKFVEKADGIDIALKNEETSNAIIEKLNNAKEKIGQLRTIVHTTNLAADSTSKSLSAIRNLLPKMSDISNATKQDISDMKNAAKKIAATSDSIEKDVTSIVDVAESDIKEILDTVNKLNSGNIRDNINNITQKIDKALVVLKRLDSTLNAINNLFDLKAVQIIEGKVSDQITKLEKIKNMFVNTTEAINNIDGIKEKANEAYDSFTNLKNEYQTSLKPELSKMYKTASDSINNMTDSILNLNVSLDNVDTAMGYMISALANGGELSANIDTLLIGFETDIDKMINVINEVKKNEMFGKALNLLKNKPEEVADFLSTPVETNEIDLYEIKTYGSKMTPFYSVLACWVGCTLLTSIFKIDIKKSKITKDAKKYQIFFGRFMLFGSLAVTQGLMIGLGDLFLGVQTVNTPLFLLTLMTSSLTFMLIIYSLTYTFGKVGQALSIVIMVLQVAGSGGTFPVELLPRGFQILQPFMPFYPAMSAARETIGGFYGSDYIMYMFILICHMISPLIIGLVIGKMTAKTKEKLGKELHSTGVME